MARIEKLANVRFHGMLGKKDASAVAIWNDGALVVADEAPKDVGNVVQVFDPDGDDFRAVPNGWVALDEPHSDKAKEMDLEGIAVDGNTVFVLGSHSARRNKVDPNNSVAANRANLMGRAESQPSRDVLLRFQFNASGRPGPIERSSLRPFLETTEPFRSFAGIASKENGVDAEGLAIWRRRLYVGFRGPVLRGGFTPILRCGFGSPIPEPEVLFVNLGGRGVRDLAHVDDGVLVLAGPIGDEPVSYQLYYWDGLDGVPGSDHAAADDAVGAVLLGDLPIPLHEAAAKPEGLALTRETTRHWELLVVFDGLQDAHGSRYRVEKPD